MARQARAIRSAYRALVREAEEIQVATAGVDPSLIAQADPIAVEASDARRAGLARQLSRRLGR